MLTITKKQFEAFDKYYADQFKRDTKAYFKEKYKDYILNTIAFDLFVEAKMVQAAKYGFAEDEYMIEYIDYCVRFSALQEDPLSMELEEILTYPDRLPKRKIEVLSQFFNSEN